MLLVPIIVSWLAPSNTINEWRSVFFLVFFVLITSNIFFCKYCKAQAESWAMLKPANNNNIQALIINKNDKNSN